MNERLIAAARAPLAHWDTPAWKQVEHTGTYIAELRAAADALAAQPAAEPAGLPVTQEPKYTVDGSHIVNRASGEAIPYDEPVFIFRARDVHAMYALRHYRGLLPAGEHKQAVHRRTLDFFDFRVKHMDRMKEPDTHAAAAQPARAGGDATAQLSAAILNLHPQKAIPGLAAGTAYDLGFHDARAAAAALVAALAAAPQPAPAEQQVEAVMKLAADWSNADLLAAEGELSGGEGQETLQVQADEAKRALRRAICALAGTTAQEQPAGGAVPAQPVLCVSSKEFKRMRAGDHSIKAWLPPTTSHEDMPLYAAPAAVEQEPLTDERVLDIAHDFRSQYQHGGTTFDAFDELGFARAIERQHGIGSSKEGGDGA